MRIASMNAIWNWSMICSDLTCSPPPHIWRRCKSILPLCRDPGLIIDSSFSCIKKSTFLWISLVFCTPNSKATMPQSLKICYPPWLLRKSTKMQFKNLPSINPILFKNYRSRPRNLTKRNKSKDTLRNYMSSLVQPLETLYYRASTYLGHAISMADWKTKVNKSKPLVYWLINLI